MAATPSQCTMHLCPITSSPGANGQANYRQYSDATRYHRFFFLSVWLALSGRGRQPNRPDASFGRTRLFEKHVLAVGPPFSTHDDTKSSVFISEIMWSKHTSTGPSWPQMLQRVPSGLDFITSNLILAMEMSLVSGLNDISGLGYRHRAESFTRF